MPLALTRLRTSSTRCLSSQLAMGPNLVWTEPVVNLNVNASQQREEGPPPVSNTVLALIGRCFLVLISSK